LEHFAAIQFAGVCGFLFLVIAVGVFILKAYLEEKLMTKSFPDGCPSFRQRVKAIIPSIV
jgi:protein-S-isoprenylcysteine O-methyltransferase Ste14